MGSKYNFLQLFSDNEEQFDEVFSKHIIRSDQQFRNDKVKNFSFNRPTIDDMYERKCPKQELIRKCKDQLIYGNRKTRSYFSLLLKNLEKGHLSLY